MSKQHPIIAVTGSSGSNRSVVLNAFDHVLKRENATWCMLDGAGFHRYDRAAFTRVVAEAAAHDECISHFSPQANLFAELQVTLRDFAVNGTGRHRRYIHEPDQAALLGVAAGTFTEWEDIPAGTDLLIYRGLHGCYKSDEVDLAQYSDLKLGVVPVVNLEWIQKIERDTAMRGYSTEAVTDTILRRMHDYVHYIVPQFSQTDINFQTVATVDTSNPFDARDVPKLEESMVVVRFAAPERFGVDFPYLINTIQNAFMSRRNAIVIPGSEMQYALELIVGPILHDILTRQAKAA